MRKKLLKIFGVGFALIAIIFGILYFLETSDRAVIVRYEKNENLKTVKADWQGTPVDEKDVS